MFLTEYLHPFFKSIAESSPATPVSPIVAGESIIRVTSGVARLPSSKARRYADALRRAIRENEENATMRLEYHRRSGLKLFNSEDVIYECVSSHRLVKSCYFVFCLTGKSMTEFIQYLRVNNNVIPDCGELSPEDTVITER